MVLLLLHEVPAVLDDFAQNVGRSAQVAELALPSTNKIVKVTIKALKGRNATLIINDGIFCFGRDM